MQFTKYCVLIFATLATSLFADNNLLYSHDSWYATSDNYGSFVDTGSSLFGDDTLTVSFSLSAKKPDNDWPYVELAYEAETPIVGTDSIQIEYKSDKALIIKLYQAELGDEGRQTYAFYEFITPPSKEWLDTTISIKDFKQPEWADEEDRKIALSLLSCSRIYFTPKLDDQVGGKAKLSIRKLYLIEE
jgi:hypothetical protein